MILNIIINNIIYHKTSIITIFYFVYISDPDFYNRYRGESMNDNEIKKVFIKGRGTYYCDKCQKL